MLSSWHLRKALGSMEKRVSLRDIAKSVGLHYSTVCLAMRNSPLLKAETKQRIQEQAKKLGYKPDPMLTALNAYRQSKRPPSFQAVIGWINNWRNREGLLAVPTYRDYYQGACEAADKLGYKVQEFWMHEKDMTPAKMHLILETRNVDGLLIAPQTGAGVSLDMDFQQFSSVAFGYSMQPCRLHLVTCHHAQAIDLLISKLVELGYRRPGYCIPSKTDLGGNYIWVSRLAYLYTKYPQLEQIPRSPFQDEAPPAQGVRQDVSPDQDELFAKWLRQYKPDVLIGWNELLKQVEALGYKVPQDIGFASPCIHSQDSHISGIDENDTQIGKAAVDLLVGMLHRGERGIPRVPIRTLLDSNWFPGKTLCPQKSSTPKTAAANDGDTRPLHVSVPCGTPGCR